MTVQEMVDRIEPFTKLKKLLDDTIAGKGRVVFMTGEAGIGKTRLFQELMAHAEEMGVTVLYGACLPLEGKDPYQPCLDALRRHSDLVAAASVSSILGVQGGQGVPGGSRGAMPVGLLGIGGMDDGDSATTADSIPGIMDKLRKLDATRERDRMNEALAGTIFTIAAKEPVLLFLDDLQWADSGTVQLLVYMSWHIHGKKVLILAAYRPEDVVALEGKPHPLIDASQKIERLGASERIQLGPFTKKDTMMLLSQIMDLEDVKAAFVDLMFERTGGNPFFIEELARSLMEQGVLDPRVLSMATGATLEGLTLPSSVRAVIEQRISKLDERSMKTLEKASVLGQEFKFDDLKAMSEMDEAALVEDLDALLKIQVLVEDRVSKSETYRFGNNVMRDVVYEGMSQNKRRFLHKKAASALEKNYAKRMDEAVYALARHYSNAGDLEKGSWYLSMAGNKAYASMALDDAARFYSYAIDCLGKLEPSKGNLSLRLEDLFTLSNIHYFTGDWDTAIEELKEVLTISEKGARPDLHAQAHIWIGRMLEARNKYDLCLKYFEKAYTEYSKMGDLDGQANALHSLGGTRMRMGEHRKALVLQEKALKICDITKDPLMMLNALTSLAGVYSELGEFKKSEENYLKAGELGKKYGDPLGLARIYNNLGDLRMRQWRYKDAIPLLEKGVLYSKKSGNIRTLAYCNSNIGESLTHAGDLVRARPHLDEATAIFTKLDEKLMTSRHVMIEGVFHRQAKEWDEARRLGKEAVDQAEKLGVPFAVGEYLMEFGVTCLHGGRKDEAREVLTRASEIFKKLGADKFLERTMSELKALDA